MRRANLDAVIHLNRVMLPEEYIVKAMGDGSHEAVELTFFTGPAALERAESYAEERYRSYRFGPEITEDEPYALGRSEDVNRDAHVG